MSEEMILDDDPRAASQKVLTLWVSRNGRAYTDERIARYDGSTHHRCECGGVAKKSRVRCDECQSKADREKYKAMPFKAWDGTTPLCIFDSDTYFWSSDDLDFYCEENDVKAEDLELVICEPERLPTLDTDFFCDCLPDDGDADLPKALLDAIDQFNAVVAKQNPLAWHGGRFRTSCAGSAPEDTAEARFTACNTASAK